jgi:hypothetical protein
VHIVQTTPGIPDWKLVRVANINPARFPDRAQALLREARMKASDNMKELNT